MIKKGIILSGGMGTRMSPLTKAVNKQLLPIYDKPLIFYPLSILLLAKIKDILIIVNKGQLNQYKKIIPNGNNLGRKVKIKFVKDRPGHDIRYALNSKKLIKSLKWKPKINILNGLKSTFNWYLNNSGYYLKLKKRDIIERLGNKD